MPVEKFRDLEQARRALWLPVGDPAIGRRCRALWRRWALIAPPVIPRGVQKFRSLAEAHAERERRRAQAQPRLFRQ
ncbi:hypothetical protein HRbin09_00874 [bacterium HR09]|nr:hypothetical protein HRbin09_00874 [bacterium HR09]